MHPAATSPSDRVPLSAKLAYGTGGLVIIFLGHLPRTLSTPIFVVLLGMSPSMASAAMLVFRLYDAFTNPIMGWISDNTRSRWGRRRPYLFCGSIASALVLPLMWFVNPAWDHTLLLWWFIGTGLLLYTAEAIYAVPYESMNLELTPDYAERTTVTSYKAFFQKIGMVAIGWAWFITQLPYFTDPATGKVDTLAGARALAVTLAVGVLIFGLAPALFIKERFYKAAANQPKIPLRKSIALTFGNRPFIRLAALTVFFACSYYLSNSMGFYIRLYYVTGGDQALSAKIEGVQSTITMILGIASIPCFTWLANRIGKTWTLMIGILLTLAGMLSKWWTYTPENPWLSMTNAIILAPSLTGIWQMIPSMTADVCDDDELKTGERREGAFASMYSLIVNCAFTLGLVISGPLVELCGLDVKMGAAQTAETIQAMRITDVILPSLMLLIAAYLLLRYPLSPQRMREIRNQLEARRGKV